ncbi:Diacylglycerol O-acyltransferase [Mycobacteroides abscessus subsp. abscessus]|nr:Diacylglycerol O-acyltransferase [Mycobacteroides abscessus subsp. abscessus]
MMAGMPFMPVSDSMFLIGETREHPFHVGGLQLFKPPVDAGPDYAEVFYEQLMSTTEVSSDFRKRGGAGHGVGGVHAAAGALTRTDGAFDDVDVLA